MYSAVLKIHLITVVLSLVGFLLRGVWMMIDSRLLQARLTRILPHIVDTALLTAGVYLAYSAAINPLEQHWLGAKIIALLVYIALGTVALKRGKTKAVRIVAWLLALAVFAYMLAVAHNRVVWPF